MSILFKNVNLPEYCGFDRAVNVLVKDQTIAYVGTELPGECCDRVIEGNGNLMIPAFYNAHCHSAMTLFRGYGDDLPLQRWLNERIFPAEDRLTSESVYYGSMVAIAEMIRNGTVSFSDMYFFLDDTARAVEESGVKANLSRSIVSFDPDIDVLNDSRIAESIDVFDRWHGKAEGRIKIDMSLHAEYTNVEKCCRYLGELTKERKTGMQVHISETASEHDACIQRHGVTPIQFFEKTGVLDSPTTAAHCVWVTDEDIEIMAQHGVSAAHNPVSNLKLGSGIMPYKKMKDAGVNVTLGTDGAASNNRLSVLREMQFAALIHKGNDLDPSVTLAADMIRIATRNGALSQGRADCGEIAVGMKADLLLVDMSAMNNIPSYNFESTVCYSMTEKDILMTLCDGNILYENGAYTTIDEEKLKSEARRVISHYFD
ncbi:MAG: amidohydrolase [Clostridia bacterium]|nr:amidohydrolase [Clostridia bacterium]